MDIPSAITNNSTSVTASTIRSGSGHIDNYRIRDSLPVSAQNSEIVDRVDGRIGVSQEDTEPVVTQFSALLINMMLDSMRRTVEQSQNDSEGLRKDFFNDLLFQQYAERMADTDALGINDLIRDSLSR